MMIYNRLKKYNYSLNIKINPQYCEYIGLVIIIICVSISIHMNCTGRSFWIDEAMLSYSFSERSIWNLTSTPLEWEQVAPVIYLYICKIVTSVFGNTEFVLRSVSIFSYITVLIMVYLLSKNTFDIKCPILCSAFVANTSFMIKYSNEFKQYMFESAVVLILFYLYYLYKKNYFSRKKLFIVFAVAIWSANPACFFVGGILTYEIMYAIYTKNRKEMRYTIYIASGIFLSFVCYYYYWLRALSEEMNGYWYGYAFMFPFGSIKGMQSSVMLISNLFRDYFSVNVFFPEISYLLFFMMVFSILIGIVKHNRYMIVILLSIILWLLASSLHRFPIYNRICLFTIPYILIICCAAGNYLKKEKEKLIFIIFILFLVVSINGIQNYFKGNPFIWRMQKSPNVAISYLRNNIRYDENVLVCRWAIPFMKYKIGYTSERIGNTSRKNIYWTENPPYTFFPNKHRETIALSNIDRILKDDNFYILTTYAGGYDFIYAIKKAIEDGFLELILSQDVNPLYYYTRNLKNIKQFAEYKIISINNNHNSCSLKLKIINTGKAYINGTEYDTVLFTSRNRKDIKLKIDRKLAPNEHIELHVLFAWEEGENVIELQLNNEGKFWFDELGCMPLRIVRPSPSSPTEGQLPL